MVPNPDFLRVMNANFPRSAKLILGCRAGARSLRAAQQLVDDGYTDILDQRAGWDAARDAFGQTTEPGWNRVGLPAEFGAPAGRAYADLAKKQ
jgi:rhodanese-related sulfurtransferase